MALGHLITFWDPMNENMKTIHKNVAVLPFILTCEKISMTQLVFKTAQLIFFAVDGLNSTVLLKTPLCRLDNVF